MKDGINILGDFEDGLDGDGGTHGVEHEDGSVFTGKTAIAIHYLSMFDFDLNGDTDVQRGPKSTGRTWPTMFTKHPKDQHGHSNDARD